MTQLQYRKSGMTVCSKLFIGPGTPQHRPPACDLPRVANHDQPSQVSGRLRWDLVRARAHAPGSTTYPLPPAPRRPPSQLYVVPSGGCAFFLYSGLANSFLRSTSTASSRLWSLCKRSHCLSIGSFVGSTMPLASWHRMRTRAWARAARGGAWAECAPYKPACPVTRVGTRGWGAWAECAFLPARLPEPRALPHAAAISLVWCGLWQARTTNG